MAVMTTSDRRIELHDRPEPDRRADQVTVDIDLCGICDSDLHSPDLSQVYRGGFALGNEAAGVLSWVGDDVEGWAVGQRVAVNLNGNVDGTCEHAAAWMEPTATALRAVGLAGNLAGADVLVTGGGPIGQPVLRLPRLRDVGRLTLVEPSEQRRGLGAASVADASIGPAAARRDIGDLRADVASRPRATAGPSSSRWTHSSPGASSWWSGRAKGPHRPNE